MHSTVHTGYGVLRTSGLKLGLYVLSLCAQETSSLIRKNKAQQKELVSY